MPPAQLKDTTMDPSKRTLIQVQVPDRRREDELEESRRTANTVDTLMGKKPEKRFNFIQENARFVDDIDL